MFRKFGPNDVIINTMRATPLSKFFIYDSNIYYNDTPSRTFTDDQTVPQTNQVDLTPATGYVSVYEYNTARTSASFVNIVDPSRGGTDKDGSTWTQNCGIVPMIYPYLTKDSARASFKTATGGKTIEGMTPAFYNNEFAFGDILEGTYPQNCTITREFITLPSSSGDPYAKEDDGTPAPTNGTYNRHYVSLKSLFDIYGVKSRHYLVSSSFANKNEQTASLIHIPSLFYGTKIRPGTVSLKWYFTGSLIGELQDTKHNGELIQVSGASANNGKVAGVVFYNEGFMYLTGSWQVEPACPEISLVATSSGGVGTKANCVRHPKWIYWGAGMNDGVTVNSTFNPAAGSPRAGDQDNLQTASFGLTFEGETKTQVMTLYAHAHRGEANYSSNPSFIEYGQRLMNTTSSHLYEENPNRRMKNTVSSAFGVGVLSHSSAPAPHAAANQSRWSSGYSASFKRQVYISKIGVYDKDYNLIGVATLGSPVLKAEDEDLAFKLKMDF